MRKKAKARPVPWDLFQPQPRQPRWWDLPVAVRERAVRLLARLLRAQPAHTAGAAPAKEVSHD